MTQKRERKLSCIIWDKNMMLLLRNLQKIVSMAMEIIRYYTLGLRIAGEMIRL